MASETDSQKPVQPEKITIDSPTEGPSLYWVTHPIRKRPLAAVLVTILILTISIFVYLMTYSDIFTGLSLIVLFGSLAKFYLPTRFKLTDTHVIVKSTTQTIAKRWSDLRSFYTDKNGVLLSPFAEPSRLENFRGLYLIFNDNKDEVVAFIKQYIPESEQTDETKESK